MANWLKCMTTDGAEVQLNLDQVAFIRPYQRIAASPAAKSFSRVRLPVHPCERRQGPSYSSSGTISAPPHDL